MKILIVGGGGREHALAWKFARDGHEVLAAPGNPGIANVASLLDIGVGDHDALIAAALETQVDLVVVGPEAPLVAGLADMLRARGVLVFGPGADGAQLEGSKAFSKEFFARHEIPSSAFAVCADMDEVVSVLDEMGGDVVVKADGLAAGKGVVVCTGRDEANRAARAMLCDAQFGTAGQRVVIERRVRGREVSVMALTDGKRVEVLAQAEDHKTIFDGDAGPNTGGMGTVSPPPWVDAELMARITREVLEPTVRGLAADGIDFRGVLYAGLMIEADGSPWLLEYNCRFGDPETQPVLMRLNSDLAVWLRGAALGEMPAASLQWDDATAVCVVLAAKGYPGSPETGAVIEGLDEAARQGAVVFHAGTQLVESGIAVAGGRVLGVTATGVDVDDARKHAYEAVRTISFDGVQYRTDIGARGETRT